MAASLGLQDECAEKLSENPEDPCSAFNLICKVFEYMPLLAVIEGKILCAHGGIGTHLTSLAEIEAIKRPITL